MKSAGWPDRVLSPITLRCPWSPERVSRVQAARVAAFGTDVEPILAMARRYRRARNEARLGRVIKTRDEVCQTFSLDQNVLPEQSLRLIAVSGTDRVDNTLMFR